MSNRRYRTKPGAPRTETDAMVRALAMEMLDGSLRELEQEIAVIQSTVNLYHAEVREREKNPHKDHGRWQVAPGVGLRAVAMLRKLREKRDAMLEEAENEIVDQALSEGAKQQIEKTNQPAASPAETRDQQASAARPATQQPAGKHANRPEPARSRGPAAAA